MLAELLLYFVLIPAVGVFVGLRLVRPAVLSGLTALVLTGVPLLGAGLTPVFC